MARNVTPRQFDCSVCSLQGSKQVLSAGPERADIVIVGESPGMQELRTGTPCTGVAGNILNNVLRKLSISRSDIFITNTVLCVSSHVKPPTTKEINCCRQRLYGEIRGRNPRVIITLGKTATKAVLSVSKSIKNDRGSIHYAEHLGAHVIITYHPAAILRTPRLYRDLLQDITKAQSLLTQTDIQVHTPSIVIDYAVINNLPQLRRFMQETDGFPEASLDVETDSTGALLCLGISVELCKAVVVVGDALVYGSRLLTAWLSTKQCGGHNIKFDMNVLAQNGITKIATAWDTMLESYTLNMFVGGHGLKHLVREHLDYHVDYSADAQRYIRALENCPTDLLYKYNAYDAALTLLLHQNLKKQLDTGDQHVLSELLYPANDALAEMERLGIMIDTQYLAGLDDPLQVELNGLQQQLYTIAGSEFNTNSSQQLADIMYNRLKLATPARWSTDAAALEMLTRLSDHPFPKVLLQYRNRKKFHATYVRGLLNAVDNNSRIHTTFNLHTTVTGRLSSARPVNIQNIPRLKEARDIFIASPGRTLIELDETQAEIRAWCWLSRDEVLRSALLSGTDVHVATACLMFGLQPDAVTSEYRTAAKRLSFATLYMMSPSTLANELKTTVAHATDLQRKFFAAYKQGRQWITDIQLHVMCHGSYQTYFGRKLQYVITPANKAEVLRQAVNYPVQNLASDITLAALVRVHRRIKRGAFGDTRLLITVHDSILLETAEQDVRGVAQAVRAEMERDILDGWLPFIVGVKIGKTWGSVA